MTASRSFARDRAPRRGSGRWRAIPPWGWGLLAIWLAGIVAVAAVRGPWVSRGRAIGQGAETAPVAGPASLALISTASTRLGEAAPSRQDGSRDEGGALAHTGDARPLGP